MCESCCSNLRTSLLRVVGRVALIVYLATSFWAPHGVEAKEVSKRDGVSVKLSLENSTCSILEYDWVGFDGSSHPRHVLKPGQKLKIDSASGHVWKVLSNHSVVGQYTVNEDPNQRFEVVEGRSIGGTPSVYVDFKNKSRDTLKSYWVDFEGNERDYGTIEPDQVVHQLTGVAHLWHFKLDGHIVARYMANEKEQQNFEIDHTSPKLVKRNWLDGLLGVIPVVNVIYATVAYGHHGPVVVTGEFVPHYRTIALIYSYKDENKPNNTVWCTVNRCGARTRYLNDEERKQYLIYVKNGSIYDANGNLFDTSSAPSLHPIDGVEGGVAIFVMDEKGEIYASLTPQVTVFHHSTFLAGKPVAAAGQMQVIQGKLKYIDNRSGHYRPPQEFVKQVFDQLRRTGYEERELKTVKEDYLPARPVRRVDDDNDGREL